MGGLLDKALFDKLLNGLAHGDAADTEAFGQIALDQARTQRKFARANGIPQAVGNLGAEGGGLDR
jgi:hypothetical protein